MSEDDVICTGAEECKKLKNAVHIFYVGDKEVRSANVTKMGEPK